MRRWTRNLARVGVSAAVVLGTVSACSSSGGTPTLNWYINPDNGAQATLAKECSASSGGAYKINTQILPNDASQQRQQLVTRLAAGDSSIDMMSLDPVFVAEFAEAGFLADVPASYKSDFTQDIVKPAVTASTWKGKLVAAPFWANTQLLWYRKSVAKAARARHDQAGHLGPGHQRRQGRRPRRRSASRPTSTRATRSGSTPWSRAPAARSSTTRARSPRTFKLGLNSDAGKDAADVIASGRAQGRTSAGRPLSTSTGGRRRWPCSRSPATSAFLVNLALHLGGHGS